MGCTCFGAPKGEPTATAEEHAAEEEESAASYLRLWYLRWNFAALSPRSKAASEKAALRIQTRFRVRHAREEAEMERIEPPSSAAVAAAYRLIDDLDGDGALSQPEVLHATFSKPDVRALLALPEGVDEASFEALFSMLDPSDVGHVPLEEFSAFVAAIHRECARQSLGSRGQQGREAARELAAAKEDKGADAPRRGSGGSAGAAKQPFPFAVGARVRHTGRGAGAVAEHMADGRTRIVFDGGEEHRYKPSSLYKLAKLSYRFAVGARVRHASRGAGVVVEQVSDGRTRVRFDDGDEHRYKASSMHKFSAEEGSVLHHGDKVGGSLQQGLGELSGVREGSLREGSRGLTRTEKRALKQQREDVEHFAALSPRSKAASEKAALRIQTRFRGRHAREEAEMERIEVQMTSSITRRKTKSVSERQVLTVVNDYAVGAQLGEGAFGRVVRATYTPTKEERAIKILTRSVLRRKRMGKGTAYDSVLREIVVMKRLDHPNCVRLFEVIDDPEHDELYLVMEFVDGGDLSAPIKKKLFTTEDTLRMWMRDVVLGLEHLHNSGICHRDIKPENVLWDSKAKRAKLADFGVSTLCGTGRAGDYVKATQGTPAFFAPEMSGDDKTGARVYSGKAADCWALGVCLYMWMYLKAPFEAPTTHMLLEKIKNAEQHEHLEFIDDLVGRSSEVMALLNGLLTRKPIQRLRVRDMRHDAFLTMDGVLELPVATRVHPRTHLQDAITAVMSRNTVVQRASLTFEQRQTAAAPAPAPSPAPAGAEAVRTRRTYTVEEETTADLNVAILSHDYNAPENQPPVSKLAVTEASSEVRESDTLAQINVGLEC